MLNEQNDRLALNAAFIRLFENDAADCNTSGTIIQDINASLRSSATLAAKKHFF